MFDVRRSSFHVTFKKEAGARLFRSRLISHILIWPKLKPTTKSPFGSQTHCPVETFTLDERTVSRLFPDHGLFVTIRKLGALNTVTPDLVWKFLFIY